MKLFAPHRMVASCYQGCRSVVLVALLVAGCGRYDQYVPIELVQSGRDPEYRIRLDLDTPEFRKALITVLTKYDVPYEAKDGKLFIPKKLARDKELMANYTAKAIDELAKTPSHLPR